MKDQKFFMCKHCGNLVGMIDDRGVSIICCGEKMEELVANTVEASREKHLPEVTVDGNTVKAKVGSSLHPMIPEHYIDWIYVQTEQGGQRKNVKQRAEAVAEFALADGDKAVAVFAYCNLHGLWKTVL
jgi:superoxide reductase